jgi:hypothetical protein
MLQPAIQLKADEAFDVAASKGSIKEIYSLSS